MALQGLSSIFYKHCQPSTQTGMRRPMYDLRCSLPPYSKSIGRRQLGCTRYLDCLA